MKDTPRWNDAADAVSDGLDGTDGTGTDESPGSASLDPSAWGLDADLVIPEVVRMDTPPDGVPRVVDTQSGLERAAQILREHEGPAAIDTERASGIRYGQRAFLVQIKRGDSPILLVDPEAFDGLALLDEALDGVEWIIHASTQDLPSLREAGMTPSALFDTELGGRLAGLPRVGLGAMTEQLLGYSLAKEHSAADWSKRPLPEAWLNYAALDVELLEDLRDAVEDLLREQGKYAWALEEFEAIRRAQNTAPEPTDPWRRTKGLRQIRTARQMTALRNLWLERDRLARAKDIAPKRLLKDDALIAAARAMPRTVPALQRIPGYQAKLIKRESARWVRAVVEAASDPDPVPYTVPSDAPPPVKAWEHKRPESARALDEAKAALNELAERIGMPHENLLTPDHLRRLCWDHAPADSEGEIARTLEACGARHWQIELVLPVLAEILVD